MPRLPFLIALAGVLVGAAASPVLAQASPPPLGDAASVPQGPVTFTVPEVAARAAAGVAERCGSLRGEAAAYQARAAELSQLESTCRDCDYRPAIVHAQSQAQVAQQRVVGCVRDIERVVADAVEQARLDALRLTGYEG